jgi:hypothetical protein
LETAKFENLTLKKDLLTYKQEISIMKEEEHRIEHSYKTMLENITNEGRDSNQKLEIVIIIE